MFFHFTSGLLNFPASIKYSPFPFGRNYNRKFPEKGEIPCAEHHWPPEVSPLQHTLPCSCNVGLSPPPQGEAVDGAVTPFESRLCNFLRFGEQAGSLARLSEVILSFSVSIFSPSLAELLILGQFIGLRLSAFCCGSATTECKALCFIFP